MDKKHQKLGTKYSYVGLVKHKQSNINGTKYCSPIISHLCPNVPIYVEEIHQSLNISHLWWIVKFLSVGLKNTNDWCVLVRLQNFVSRVK